MTLIIESTNQTVLIGGTLARLWTGTTETGEPVEVYVVAVSVPENTAALEYFERELTPIDDPKPFAI